MTIDDIFGAGSSQTATHLIVNKAALGLPDSCTAEAFLSAVILRCSEKMQGRITSETGANLTDERGIPLYFDNSETHKNSVPSVVAAYWRKYHSESIRTDIFVLELNHTENTELIADSF